MVQIVLASEHDVAFVGELYDCVNDYFENHTNYCYPNWQKGKYPTIKEAQTAFENHTLYVLKNDDSVLGAMIIDHCQHPAYKKIPWTVQVPDECVMSIHTVVVAPAHRNQGFGERLIQFGIELCKSSNAKTIRLDTHYKNIPARHLYEKCGFHSLGCHTAFVDNRTQEFDVFEYLF